MKFNLFIGTIYKQLFIISCFTIRTQVGLDSVCFCITSENKEHDTIAVHLFQRKLVSFLAEHFGTKPNIIIDMSDSCAGQYTRTATTLKSVPSTKNLGISAEWHFFATSHGKSPADGIAGTVNRSAAKASLQRPYEDQILTPINYMNSFHKIS